MLVCLGVKEQSALLYCSRELAGAGAFCMGASPRGELPCRVRLHQPVSCALTAEGTQRERSGNTGIGHPYQCSGFF